MKKRIRGILGQLHRQAPMRQLIGATGRPLLLPFYHTVSDTRLPHIANLYAPRNTKQFIQDLEFLCRHFQPVTLDELYQVVAGQRPHTKPVFHLTFDDGLKEVYTVIAPILEQKGIPATVFLNTGFLDNKALFFRYKVSLILESINTSANQALLTQIAACLGFNPRQKPDWHQRLLSLGYHDQQLIEQIANILQLDFDAYLQKEQPYLTSAQIKDLQQRDFTFGSHSIDHPLFSKIPLEEQKRQVQQSLTELDRLGISKNRYFSFPFSDDGVSLELIKWLHTEADCKLTFGISGLKDDVSPYHLHRVPVEGTAKPMEQLIKSEYLYYLLKVPFRKNTVSRT